MPGYSARYLSHAKKPTINGDLNHVHGNYRKNVQNNVVDQNTDGREVHNTNFAGGQVNVRGSIKGRGKAVGREENNIGDAVSRSNSSNGEDTAVAEPTSPEIKGYKLGSPPQSANGPKSALEEKKLKAKLAEVESSSDSEDDASNTDGDTSELSSSASLSDSDSDASVEEPSTRQVLRAIQKDMAIQKEELANQARIVKKQNEEISELKAKVKELESKRDKKKDKGGKRSHKKKSKSTTPEPSEVPQTPASPRGATEEHDE